MLDTTSPSYRPRQYRALDTGRYGRSPRPRPGGPMTLGRVVGAAVLAASEAQKRISFHPVGDTGAATPSRLRSEDTIAAAMAPDLQGRPST
jgi:hypothetical protein